MSNENNLSGPHDSRECGFNYREERTKTHKLPFNGNDSSLPFVCDSNFYNGQVKLTRDELIIKLYNNENTKGLYIDDIIAIVRTLTNSLRPCPEHEAMITLMMACNILKDNRARVITDNFSESPMERDTPPSPSVLPSKEEWNRIYEMLFQFVEKE